MKQTTRAISVLFIILGMMTSSCSNAQQAIETGTWSGQIVGDDNRPQPLSFDVRRTDDSLSISVTVLGPNVSIDLNHIRWDGATLSYELPVQTVLECQVEATPAGALEGSCSDTNGIEAAMTMIPPSLAEEQPAYPPVDATRPSRDPAILNPPGTFSDGSPLQNFATATLDTGEDLISEGFVGGLSVDADGNVFTANFSSHVWKITPAGNVSVLSDEFEGASGNLPLENGDLLQGEWHENKIYRITPDGDRSVFSEEGLDGPVGMLRMPDGSILVANSRGEYLASIPPDGGAASEVASHPRMTQPNGVVMDDQGQVFISDLDSGIVFRWSPGNEVDILTELPGRANAHAAFHDGALYVAKIWDHVIYQVDSKTGVFGIVSGTGRPGYDDGMTGSSMIEEPNGIAVDQRTGTIYVNTHRGVMGRGNPGYLVIRTLEKSPK